MPPQLEKNHVVPTAWQDEALARDGVSRVVPCSALKGETVPDSLPATPKPGLGPCPIPSLRTAPWGSGDVISKEALVGVTGAWLCACPRHSSWAPRLALCLWVLLPHSGSERLDRAGIHSRCSGGGAQRISGFCLAGCTPLSPPSAASLSLPGLRGV